MQARRSLIEIVGTYNPLTDPADVNLKSDRVEYWLAQGAKPSGHGQKPAQKETASEPACISFQARLHIDCQIKECET